MVFLEAQVNTQEYGRRPYGVGFLVIGFDESGPHLFEFSPSGNSYEYYAMSIGARSQSAKTYLEKHYEEFADGEFGPCLLGNIFNDFPSIQHHWKIWFVMDSMPFEKHYSRIRSSM